MNARRLVHRGTVSAHGWLVDSDVLGDRARDRVLALWRPGARVNAVVGGFLVTLPGPVTARCAALGATPLVRVGGRLVAAPLSAKELASAGDAPLVRVVGGVVTGEVPGAPVDVAAWLEADASVVAVTPLGHAPKVEVALPGPLAIYAPHLTSPTAEATRVRDAMLQAATPSPPFWARWLHRFALWMSAAAPQGRPPPASAPAERGALRQALDRFERWAAGITAWTGLQSVLDSAHAAYLDDLLRRFDSGDLDEALKRAIPLAAKPNAGQPPLPTWLPPSPRGALKFTATATGPGRSLGLGTELFELLRETYRRAAEKLAREGRFDEAAFVLGELLGSAEEAVAMLETHGRYEAAAALAEAKELAPGLVVRLWFLAKDADRAVLLARRSGAWTDAITRLEARDKVAGMALRWLWASVLAEGGEHRHAIEVVWPHPALRERARPWLDALVTRGGSESGSAVAKLVELDAATLPEALRWLDTVARDPSPEAREARASFYVALVRLLPATPAAGDLGRLAASALRAGLCDWPLPGTLDRAWVDQVGRACGDLVLVADIGGLALTSSGGKIVFSERSDVVDVTAPQDAGSVWPILDAVPLHDGRILVARGEAGVWLVGPDGRVQARYEQPATALVVNLSRTRALAIAPRGRAHRVVRLDLITRAAGAPCDAPFLRAADSYDGDGWWVASDDELMLVDALSDRFRVTWRVNRLGADVDRIVWSGGTLAILLRRLDPERGVVAEAWRYDVLPPVLRKRGDLPRPNAQVTGVCGDALVQIEGDATGHALHVAGHPPTPLDGGFPVGRPFVVPGWFTVPLQQPDGGCRVELWSHGPKAPKRRAILRLAGVPVVHRIVGDTLIVASDRGEVGVFDLVRGDLRRWVRVRA